MAYRDKTYIAFDADSDIHYYRLMQAWKQNDNTNFNFDNAHDHNDIRSWSSEESKKIALRERLKLSSALILLVGEKTRYQNTYVRWEIEQAQKMDLPIIVVNLNGRRSCDETLCPLILREALAIHVTFNPAIIQFALQNWPNNYARLKVQGATGPYYYDDSIYERLNISRR